MKYLLSLALVGLVSACSTVSEPRYSLVGYDNSSQWMVTEDRSCKVNRFYVGQAQSVNWTGPCFDGFAIGKGRLDVINQQGDGYYAYACLQPDHWRSECLMGGGGRGH
ncbi:hypothetical protein [Aliagarivorans taiwanensis]|uniref:hypothetical protein n=1 Tax=Aliagarivorans taiwanensis TaxID=561966 RepID=UPI00047BC2A8|nr:hypothetical protein [Aliagarivorans taiwanensis]